MVSTRELEKMLRPYECDWGAASEFHDYHVYRFGEKRVRVEEFHPLVNDRKSYRTNMLNAARELGLIPTDGK